jgi:hypothetical protein
MSIHLSITGYYYYYYLLLLLLEPFIIILFLSIYNDFCLVLLELLLELLLIKLHLPTN